MARELKFRAWFEPSEEYKKELYQRYGNYIPDPLCSTYTGEDLFKSVSIGLRKFKSYPVVEQYTGLTDKNGKEIYEGDIVKINKGKWGKDGEWVARKELHKGVFIVEYDELNANFVSISKEEEDEEELLSFADKLYEVIGNIHENPELLKEKQ